MEIKYWAGTDVGRKRSDNEDNFLIDKRLKLFVVADGMGGHASGEIASAMAVHGIREVIDRERDIFDTYDDDDPKCHVEVCTLLEYAVHATCAQIFHKARREPEKRGMGTTLVVLLFINARGFIAYVGDSRIYLLRGGIVYQLTEDHSLRNELIRMGKVTADEFETSPYANLKNAMTRAVGVYESVEVDTLDFDIIPGDAFLLCSDGLYEYLSDEEIGTAIALPEIREVPGLLIDQANTRGGKDNITGVVVQVAGDHDDHDRAADINFALDILKNVPLFRELSYQQLVRVMNLSHQSTFEAGQELFTQGAAGHELFVVLRGRVELTRGGVRVAEVGAGAHLGEMSLVDDAQRSATATALEPGKVLTVQRDDFYEVLRREPALAVKLLWSFVRVLADRLRTTTSELAEARSSVLTDLTELTEEAARSGSHPRLALVPTEDAAEQRPRASSGTVIAPSPDDPTRAEPQFAGAQAAAAPPEPKTAAPAFDPKATLVNTTTSNPDPVDTSAPTLPQSRPSSAPQREASDGVVAPASAGTTEPSEASDPFAAPPAPEFAAPGVPPVVAEQPSHPIMTSAARPVRSQSGRTEVGIPAVPVRAESKPKPQAKPKAQTRQRGRKRADAPTEPNLGAVVSAEPRGSTEPAGPPADPPAEASPATPPRRKSRRATLPQIPARPPGEAPPAPQPAASAPRQTTMPTPAVPVDQDAPQAPAARRITAAPQASPTPATEQADEDRVQATPPSVPPPPPTRRKSGPSAAASSTPPPPPTAKPPKPPKAPKAAKTPPKPPKKKA